MAVSILVTGGAGNLGKAIAERFRAANIKTLICGRKPSREVDMIWDIGLHDAPLSPSSLEYGELTVIHAAAKIGSYRQPLSDADSLLGINVQGTLRVVRWCVVHGVKRLILISGAIVYGEWQDTPKHETDPVKPWVAGPYAISKWCSEQVAHLVESEGVELSILRLSSLYGSDYKTGLIQHLLQQAHQHQVLRLHPPMGDAFDLLHVSDAAEAVWRVCHNQRNRLWNIGSGRLTTLRELAEICAHHSNATISVTEELPSRPARILNWVDDRAARKELGFANRVTLAEGIAGIASQRVEAN